MLNTNTRTIRTPFTATQWQELEHQALIFKYMVSGVPIPHDLIYSVKRSLDSSFSSRLFPPKYPIGWGCYETGFGRKVDPEPGRCRRTDGKKWRCSKEAFPDSKYCERHMHRGKNRSRKPVEVSSSSTTTSNTTIADPSSNLSSISRNQFSSYSSLPSSLTTEPYVQQHRPKHNSSSLYPFHNYSHSASSRPSPCYGFSASNNTNTHLSPKTEPFNQTDEVYSGGLSSNKYFHDSTKESQDELAFFPESSGNGSSSFGDSCNPLMSSYRGYSSQPQYQDISDNSKHSQQSEDQHCFILGTDFKSPKQIKADKDSETQKHFHHFFGEWPPKNTESWLDLASNSRVPNDD